MSSKMSKSSQGSPPPPSPEDVPTVDEWQSELRRRCVVVGEDIDDYIKKVMPDDNITRPELNEYKGGHFRLPKKGCDDYQSKLVGAVVSLRAPFPRSQVSQTSA